MGESTELLAAQLETKAIASVWSGTVWIPRLQLAEFARTSVAAIDKWVADGRLFGLTLDGESYFPRYALDERYQPMDVISHVLRIFQGENSNMSVAAWFESTSGFLRGARPRELVSIDSDLVVAAARNSLENERYAG